MITKVLSNLYTITIPLPNNPLKATNSYFIQGKGKNLLIDTGFNQAECREAIDEAMREIGFSMENTDIFVTHVHGDHSGLIGYLAKPDTKVYCGDYCAQVFADRGGGIGSNYISEQIIQSGLLKMGMVNDVRIHPGVKYASGKFPTATVVRDGDLLEVGDFTFRCIETTGHAPDHICLYEPKLKILFSGDHILGKITPNNTIWNAPWTVDYDYLEAYLKNLDKIASMQINLTLPGHREILTDCYARIDELKTHHQTRLDNILEIFEKEKMNGAEVASQMKWSLTIKSWDEFPPSQKFFATGEALSHLTHLVCKGILAKELHDGVVYYFKN